MSSVSELILKGYLDLISAEVQLCNPLWRV
ncbi:hypothetical protein AERO9A_210017 [Aeromonas salmonicida]|nr:hypothetical protein AERO9A_210017 [Aeromonas salmonicida]